jgi:hypothetical protein
MEEYKAYLLEPDGRIASRVDLLCKDEKAARERAQQIAQDCVPRDRRRQRSRLGRSRRPGEAE